MDYVDLQRRFSRLEAEQAFSAEAWQGFGHGYFGGLGWEELLERPRVVILAEAAAGKSAEFRARVDQLQAADQHAFYVTVEALATYGLDGSLGREESVRLERWRQDGTPGWFFLDSVDEARLNRKGVEEALNRFARELGPAYDRARVLLSCRGSIWTGKSDLALVERTLRVPPQRPPDADPIDPDVALLGLPNASAPQPPKPTEIPPITVVALTKLSEVQRKVFLTAAGVTDIENFEQELYARGLQQLAERPGDLRMLTGYWRKYRKFGGLSEMLDLGIIERLVEQNETRRTLTMMGDDTIRAGAERLAAALVLGRSMNLVLPGQLPDGEEGIDPRRVLGDWPPAEVDHLLARGLFVPATFGLVRFYHRSAQEYLAASWFRRMGDKLTDPELDRIFLCDMFGIRTVPPSLRATAAWLALWRPTLRRHLLEREPLILLLHGDPGRLSLAEKTQLLETFAMRQARADVAYVRIDHQALWMFAEQALAPAIANAIALNPREDFQLEMLRLIEQGDIKGCIDIARAGALEPVTRPYHRIVATRTLRRLGDTQGLGAVAADILAHPDQFGPELAPSLTVELFPDHLSVTDLLVIIANSRPGREHQSEGFERELVLLFDACPDGETRRTFVAGLAELAFEPPWGDWPKVSTRHTRLASRLAPVARRAIADADHHDYGDGVVRLLMAVERAGSDSLEPEAPALSDLVAARPALRQALFWADVAHAVAEAEQEGTPLRTWRQVWPGNRDLWSLAMTDIPWLEAALGGDREAERHVALSALIEMARGSESPDAALDRLATLVAADVGLSAALAEERQPRVETDKEIKRREQNAVRIRFQEQEKARDDQFWRDLRDRLQADPTRLRDPALLSRWPGPVDLWRLTNWLAKHSKTTRGESVRNWEMMAAAFGSEVALAYRDGLKILWRVTKPERPKDLPNGQHTVKHTITMSFAGITLEATEDPDWVRSLDAVAAERAALHALLDQQGMPQWIGDLLVHHEAVVAPHVAAQLTREWRGASDYRPLLDRATSGLPLPAQIRTVLLHLIRSKHGAPPAMTQIAGRLLARLALADAERAELIALFTRRLANYRRDDAWDATVNTLAILFQLDQRQAADRLLDIVAAERRRRHKSRAGQLLKALFGRHRGMVGDLSRLAPATLAQIILEAYRERGRHRSVSQDEGDPANDRFDDAGGAALSALISLDGPEAHAQMLSLSRQVAVGDSGHRLRELAYEMAERNAERPAWAAADLQAFEHKLLAPIGNGDDLLDLALRLIDAITASFHQADMSPRKVIATAADEAAVQEWLGSELNLRGQGRVHAHRESQIAHDDRPDLLLSSTTSYDEVAIELKHGEKDWSFLALSNALAAQLAQKYLLPPYRRHGILVISHHRETRFWRDVAQRRRMSFSDVIARLQRQAASITSNETGPITVTVRGIDTTPGRATGEQRDADDFSMSIPSPG